jgi:YD repeat-containing protein
VRDATTIPQPGDPAATFAATYDAFNRLVKVAAGANTVAEYEYDPTGRRIIKSVYSGGTLDHRQHFYYNAGWQTLEVRKETGGTEDADPLEQYVYHAGGIDSLILPRGSKTMTDVN